eukprot:6123798-Pleurochrysis_carterae.AAC.1
MGPPTSKDSACLPARDVAQFTTAAGGDQAAADAVQTAVEAAASGGGAAAATARGRNGRRLRQRTPAGVASGAGCDGGGGRGVGCAGGPVLPGRHGSVSRRWHARCVRAAGPQGGGSVRDRGRKRGVPAAPGPSHGDGAKTATRARASEARTAVAARVTITRAAEAGCLRLGCPCALCAYSTDDASKATRGT